LTWSSPTGRQATAPRHHLLDHRRRLPPDRRDPRRSRRHAENQLNDSGPHRLASDGTAEQHESAEGRHRFPTTGAGSLTTDATHDVLGATPKTSWAAAASAGPPTTASRRPRRAARVGRSRRHFPTTSARPLTTDATEGW